MATFHAVPGLDEIVARRYLAPAVDRLKGEVRDAAAMLAPDGKVWITMRDDRVRPTHRAADGQAIPANIPYVLRRPPPRQGTETADRPRDPALSAGNRIECRCESLPLPAAVARSLRTSDTRVMGTHVSADVHTDYPRAAESEHAASGGGWMRGARDLVADRLALGSPRH